MHDEAAAHKAGLVAVNTTLAPCVAGLLVFSFQRAISGLLDVGAFCNGILGGLVSITAGCAFVKPWEAILIGFFGGFVYIGASKLMKMVKVDDVVDAFAVHGACGFWGALALGFFGNSADGMDGNGLLHHGKFDQFGVQFLGCLCIVLWVGALSLALFVPMKLLKALRLSDEFQDQGADKMEHSPRKAYDYDSQKLAPAKDAIEVDRSTLAVAAMKIPAPPPHWANDPASEEKVGMAERKTAIMRIQNRLQQTFSKDLRPGTSVWEWTYENHPTEVSWPPLYRATVKIPVMGKMFTGSWKRGQRDAQLNVIREVIQVLDAMDSGQ
jgi:hypothetical protein